MVWRRLNGRISPKAITRFKEQIREKTRRTRGISLTQMSKELTAYLRCWLGYSGDLSNAVGAEESPSLGYTVDFARWCGSNGSVDEHDTASFANGVSVRTWRRKPPAVLRARGGSRTRPLCTLPCLLPIFSRSGFLVMRKSLR